MSVTVKRFNWVRTTSAWEAQKAWRERQAKIQENFEATIGAASSSFFGASVDLTSGLSSIAAQRAVQRMQAAAQTVDKLA